jgi:transcriptional regulator with PAS, ATPase and Fis domain
LFQTHIVYVSEAMKKLLDVAYSVADTESSVLLYGESGTGKEVLANYIHTHSKRGSKEMVVINCASLPESLLEAELFGYEKGAFTGASCEKHGLIELADKGTLFLDEINSIPLALQGKLLRVLETKRLKRIGSLKEKQVDFRLLSAANENLRQCIDRKTFRADLYYRLSVVPLVIPPLRSRRDDIVPLCRHFLRFYGEKYGKTRIFSEETLASLRTYHWPGNVRELKNLMERLIVTHSHTSAQIMAIPPEMFDEYPCVQEKNAPLPLSVPEDVFSDDLMSLVKALERHNGARKDAARELGISLRTLQYRLKKYRITTKPALQILVKGKLLGN